MKKSLKIKIPPQDINAFGMDELIVDPFWNDIYGIDTIKEEEEEEEESDEK